MQGDGNLVEYGANSVVWETATNFNGADAVMQGDGNFVVHSSAGSAAWASRDGGNPGAYLSLSNVGQLAVLSPSGLLLWAA